MLQKWRKDMFDLEEELKKLPDLPGVYIMHDNIDTIIYVGKAVNLKNRVRQYFRENTKHTAKIRQMVSHISYFEYIITDSELEALVLECNLIKEHSPKYNTMLKDDKTYPFIKVTTHEAYPRVFVSRDIKHGTGRFFGPYTSSKAVNDTIELLCKLYKIRTCNRRLPKDTGKERPCLNYHIGQCSAPCQGYIDEETYRKAIDEVIEFLNGNHTKILGNLMDSMKECAQNMQYEEAAKYRDLIGSVKQVAQKQKITTDDNADRDVIACASDGNDAVVQVFFIREGKLLGRDHFHMAVAQGDGISEILSQFIKQYYGGTPYIPNVIMIQKEIEDADVVAAWLTDIKKTKVKIITQKKGDKEKLVELAYKNAQNVLLQDTERIKNEQKKTIGAMTEIAKLIGLPAIKRAEAYDISNTNGVESVGSMIVFQDGKPKKNDYRKFKIKTVKGPDDYKSMKEVLTRRFKRAIEGSKGFEIYPDLIMMDGGRGQVNIALEVLKELGLSIPVCGMVKDDNHNTRGLYYNNKLIAIDTHSEGFKLITRIQDEAHRFAIEYHRSLRSKQQVHSILDGIEGIGPARRKSLMKHFLDIEKIRQASVEELMKADGITKNIAQNIYRYFH
jgi:excinuclease ABC subunit C